MKHCRTFPFLVKACIPQGHVCCQLHNQPNGPLASVTLRVKAALIDLYVHRTCSNVLTYQHIQQLIFQPLRMYKEQNSCWGRVVHSTSVDRFLRILKTFSYCLYQNLKTRDRFEQHFIQWITQITPFTQLWWPHRLTVEAACHNSCSCFLSPRGRCNDCGTKRGSKAR